MNENDIDIEAVRLTAYFLWEQEGRPDTNPDDFWQRALEMHERAKRYGTELEAGWEVLKTLPSDGVDRSEP